MMPSSILYPGERIIEDNTNVAMPDGMSTGYQGMFKSAASAARLTSEFPSEMLIDESEWESRIAETEGNKSRLSDLMGQASLQVKNQKSTNYCWIFAPTHALEVMRVVQGQRKVSLSPASAGARIKKFRNVGGWGEEGIEWLMDNGATPSNRWPDTAIDKSYDTEENRAAAKKYRVTEWDRLQPRNLPELVSCLLVRKPVAIGLNWWGHEVLAVEAVWLDGKVAIRIRNSWGDIPDFPNGYGILRGNKMLPDDAVSPRVVTAS